VRLTYTVEQAGRPPARSRLSAWETFVPKVKKKCCRSKPRCKSCPVVAMRRAKFEADGLKGKELKRAVKQARKR